MFLDDLRTPEVKQREAAQRAARAEEKRIREQQAMAERGMEQSFGGVKKVGNKGNQGVSGMMGKNFGGPGVSQEDADENVAA